MAQMTPEEKAKLAEAEASAAAWRKEQMQRLDAPSQEFMADLRSAYRQAEQSPKREAEAAPSAPASPPYTPAEDAQVANALEPALPEWYRTRNGPGRDEYDNQ